MRTIVNLEENQVAGLDAVAARRGVSRAAVVREAVQTYLVKQTSAEEGEPAGFGAWAKDRRDAVRLQRRLRTEWER